MLNVEYMKLAISEAKKAKSDIPVGALIVKDGKIIASACNKKEEENKVTAHAELIALERANKALKNWRLDDCEMYVTLEPCPMCAWAILSARIKNLYFGCFDNLYGGFSVLKLQNYSNTRMNIKGGILEEENKALLDNYFKGLRK